LQAEECAGRSDPGVRAPNATGLNHRLSESALALTLIVCVGSFPLLAAGGAVTVISLSQSFQRPDPLQFRKVENRQDALGQCNKATIAKQAEYPADMDRGQSNRVGNVLLAQRKRVALFAYHIHCRDTRHHMQEQMCNAFLGRTLTQCGKQLGRFVGVGDERVGKGRLNSRACGEPRADFRARESAYLNSGQCLDREMERFLKNSDRGKQVSWQQEFQDLPSAIGKLEVAESPALAEDEHVAGYLVSDGDLLARAGRNEVLPAQVLVCFRLFGGRSE
jgi:hypothetical protein